MPGVFQGLNMASNALRAFQRGLDTTGHNIANVNTAGYSRQRVEYGTNPPLNLFDRVSYQLGQGVNISSVSRIRDAYLDQNMASASANYGRSNMAATGLSSLEGVFNEPSDSGISAALDSFFNAWSGLSSDPSDPSALQNVQNSGQTLTDRVRAAYKDVSTAKTNSGKEITATIKQVNALGDQIAKLNKAILQSTSSGGTANDLMDQRDAAYQELSGLVNTTKEVFPDGQYAVYTAGFTLVDSAGSRTFPNTFDAAAGTVTDGTHTYNIKSGQLSGLLISSNEASNQMAKLDDLANTLRTQVNALHATGINSNGNTGVLFFNDVAVPPQTGAIDFDLSAAVKADPNEIASGISGKAGDGGLASGIADLRDGSMAALGNDTFSNYFKSAMNDLSSKVSYYKDTASSAQAVVTQIDNQIQAVSGVSLDDEMANMLQFQRSYQAAAKVVTVFDQVASDLIAMLNR